MFKETEAEEKSSAAPKAKGGKAKPEGNTTSKAVKKNNDSMEKSTLGDIDALSALKASLEKGEK